VHNRAQSPPATARVRHGDGGRDALLKSRCTGPLHLRKNCDMLDLVRREVIQSAKTIVIKIGSQVLARVDDTLDTVRIAHISEQIHRIRSTGRRVIVVSSGAVAAGFGLLNFGQRPVSLPRLQAAAAAGQPHLIRHYDDCLRSYGYYAAQILLTAEDFNSRERYLNMRFTLSTLLDQGAVPIVNENDTVSTDEIKFGDNDRLAAMVANLLENPLLIILSNVDGLYTDAPDLEQSQLIPLVEKWSDALLEHVATSGTRRGTGGMLTKLQAARDATAVGENVIIANGTHPNVLQDILDGKPTGTLFLAQGGVIPAWKRWIGYTAEPQGRFVLDDGAHRAVGQAGKSLLAIGVCGVEGEFAKGGVVNLCSKSGAVFARGLTNYDSRDSRQIAGMRTDQIQDTLGSVPYVEMVHRDNLVITA
jgi:glutamate 5-kinase